jgi:hypothetical protein
MPRRPSTTATLLLALERTEHETAPMLPLDELASVNTTNRRELKRRVLAIRAGARERTAWLDDVRLEPPTK